MVGRSKAPVDNNGMILTLMIVIITHVENTKSRRGEEDMIPIPMRVVLVDPESIVVLDIAMILIQTTVTMGEGIKRGVREGENDMTLIQKMKTAEVARRESDHIIDTVTIQTLKIKDIITVNDITRLLTLMAVRQRMAPNPKEPKCHQVTNQDYKLHLTLL